MRNGASYEYLDQGGLVVTLHEELHLANYACFEADCARISAELASGAVGSLLIDCRETSTLGCTALGLFLRLWKVAERYGCRFALCGLSPLERETVAVCKLDRLWAIYPTRERAILGWSDGPARKSPRRAKSRALPSV
jgi:anti-anti-sigma factor